MKLAEALVLRADTQRRIARLRQRMIANAKVQEGDQPAEDPRVLFAEIDRLTTDLTDLIQRINRTNAITEFEAGVTVSDALAVRDTLKLRHDTMRELASNAVVVQHRYSRSEVRFVSAVDVADIQQRADDLAREHRELDTRIQELNWLTELVE
jgi:predicted transcriptional regulator